MPGQNSTLDASLHIQVFRLERPGSPGLCAHVNVSRGEILNLASSQFLPSLIPHPRLSTVKLETMERRSIQT